MIVKVAAAIASIDSELIFLLESPKVPLDIVAKFGALGCTDIDTFANMEVGPTAPTSLDPCGGPPRGP